MKKDSEEERLPPIQNFFGDPEKIDVEALAVEERANRVASEVEEARYRDFLNQIDDDALDFEEVEAEEKEARHTGLGRQMFLDAETSFRESERRCQHLVFWNGSSRGNSTNGKKTLQVQIVSGQDTILPKEKIAQNLLVSNKATYPVFMTAQSDGSKGPNPVQAEQWFIENIPVLNVTEKFYCYDDFFHVYLPQRASDIKRRITDCFRRVMFVTGNTRLADRVFDLLKSDSRICSGADVFNNSFVAFTDGLLNLDTWEFIIPTPKILTTTGFRAAYHKGTQTDCPKFKEFLHLISGSDLVLEERIWQAMGYLFVPDQAKAIILFQGVGNSGKSTLSNFVVHSFVGDVVSRMTINELSNRFSGSDLVGMKLLIDFDLPNEILRKDAVSALKKLTGQDEMSSDVKFDARIRFLNTAKPFFSTNHPLRFNGYDEAFLERLVVIPFANHIPPNQMKNRFSEVLDEERDAIVVRALNAYRRLKNNNFDFDGDYPLNMVVDRDNGENPATAVTQFLIQHCEFVEGVRISTRELYQRFIEIYGMCCQKRAFSYYFHCACKNAGLKVNRKRAPHRSGTNPEQGYENIRLKEKKA